MLPEKRQRGRLGNEWRVVVRATGKPRLAKLIGRTAVNQVCEWPGLSDVGQLVTKPVSQVVDWPKPLSQAAYHGVVGKIVNAIEPPRPGSHARATTGRIR